MHMPTGRGGAPCALPQVNWADICPSRGQIHSLIHSFFQPVTHSFNYHFLSTYCVPSTVLGMTVNEANAAGDPWGHSAGDPHTSSIPPLWDLENSFPKEMASE